jgi:hypothetical protein
MWSTEKNESVKHCFNATPNRLTIFYSCDGNQPAFYTQGQYPHENRKLAILPENGWISSPSDLLGSINTINFKIRQIFLRFVDLLSPEPAEKVTQIPNFIVPVGSRQ